MVPGEKMDEPDDPKTTGKTLSRWVVANRGDLRGPEGLPIWKPPYSRIVAIDMKTGEFLWEIPNGDTPEHIRNHPALKGLTFPPPASRATPCMLATKTLLITAPGGDAGALRDRQEDRPPAGHASSCRRRSQYGMMGYLHQGRQYVVVQVGSPAHPGSLVALRLPAPKAPAAH